MTHICVGKQTIIGSDNGLSPGRRQAIIWTNAGILLNGPLGTNFSEFSIVIQTFSFNEMHLKMSSAKWRPFCLGLSVLIDVGAWISNHIPGFLHALTSMTVQLKCRLRYGMEEWLHPTVSFGYHYLPWWLCRRRQRARDRWHHESTVCWPLQIVHRSHAHGFTQAHLREGQAPQTVQEGS